MNTRGLMELIALNVGYDLGILTPEIFTMMVLMALVTTAMTGPLLSLSLNWGRRRASPRRASPAGHSPTSVVPQRAQRIGPRRAPGRNERRHDHAAQDDGQRAREGHGVGRADAEQRAARGTG